MNPLKITILENGIKNEESLKNGISQAVSLCSSIGLHIDLNYQTIDKIFDGQSVNTDVVQNGWGVNPHEILNCVTEPTDVVVLISSWTKVKPFNWSVSNPINPCTYDLDINRLDNTIVIEIMEEWYGSPTSYPEVLCQFFLHELLHTLYDKTGVLPDLTHYQYANSQYSQKSPTSYYLFLITSLLSKLNITPKPPVSDVILTRNFSDNTQTQGTLTVNGNSFNCKTLERPDLGNKPNISCVPKGLYDVRWSFSLRMLKYTYEVLNVPSRSGIRLHSANFYTDLQGCIALGNGYQDINADGHLDVINSKITIKAFEDLMGRKPFKLLIQ